MTPAAAVPGQELLSAPPSTAARRWLKQAVATAGLAAWLLAGHLGCTPRDRAPTVAEMQEVAGPTRESWDVTYRIDDNGVPRVHVDSGYLAEVEVNEDSLYILLQADPTDPDTALTPPSGEAQTVATLFDARGDSSAVLVADQLFVHDAYRRIDARGAVVVTTTSGKRLEAEYLLWYENDERIWVPDFFRLTTPTEQIQGYALDADEALETYTMRRVTGRVQL